MVKEDKLKALDVALGQIEKQFGKGSGMRKYECRSCSDWLFKP